MPAPDGEKTDWIEISFDIHPFAHEPLSGFLFELGCSGVVSENLDDPTLKAYLPLPDNPDDVKAQISFFLNNLQKAIPEIGHSTFDLKKIENRDWSSNWREFFHKDRITEKLTVFPAWEPVPTPACDYALRIDPGPAFGTGRHPSTRMCLKAMEKIPLPGLWSMLDVGTGSGILAIFGAIRGADKVLAIDTDEEAVRWAGRNIGLNGLEGSIEISSIPIEQIDTSYSLVVANLIIGEIRKIFPYFSPCLSQGGWLILSGILSDQAREIKWLLDANGFCEHETLNMEEWRCIIAGKK